MALKSFWAAGPLSLVLAKFCSFWLLDWRLDPPRAPEPEM